MKMQEELERPGQAPRKGSKVGPGDFVFARRWHCSEQAWLWFEQQRPRCVPSSLLKLYGQLQKMLT